MSTTRIGIILAISLAFFVAEITVGFKTRSLALIADAFHYFNDVVAYAIAFAAAYLQERGQHTHGFTYAFHRAELVGAFFNGVFLLALALSIFLQSIERFTNIQPVDSPLLVLITACVGLGLNIISAFVVHDHGHGHSHGTTSYELQDIPSHSDPIHATHNHVLNPPVQAPQHNLALLSILIHLLGDAINNIGVIVAAVIFLKVDSPNRFYADPAASLAISLIIFYTAIPMTLKSGRILLEASPNHLDLGKVKEDLLSIPDVLSIHDLHVWNLSQSSVASPLAINNFNSHLNILSHPFSKILSVILGSLHVCVPIGTSLKQWERTEKYLQHCFEEYGINHVTISPEIHQDSRALTDSIEEMTGKCRSPSAGDFGCAVNTLKKRRVVTDTA